MEAGAPAGTAARTWDIVMTGWAGDLGSAALLRARWTELEKRLPASFLERAAARLEGVSQGAEGLGWAVPLEGAEGLGRAGSPAGAETPGLEGLPQGVLWAATGEDGVFGALWRLGEEAGTGLWVDLARIPLLQETIEICEMAEVSPYELPWGGFLWLAENGNWSGGTVIGHTTQDSARVVESRWGTRYLTPPEAENCRENGCPAPPETENCQGNCCPASPETETGKGDGIC